MSRLGHPENHTLLCLLQDSVKFFSKLNSFIFEYVDPINIFFDNKNNIFFRGDLRYISAKTATLAGPRDILTRNMKKWCLHWPLSHI